MHSDYEKIVWSIVKAQEAIIGPIALTTANKVTGLQMSEALGSISMGTDKKKILSDLIKQYESIFGRASVEVCRDAVRPLLPQYKYLDLPDILK